MARDPIRNVRTYDHFCVLARTMERIGDRWSLLVIRDLLSGPKRFTDLMGRLGGITPKTLTQRLRELDDAGIVLADREAGRREVWYRLTEAGVELEPAVEALAWWGWRHAWRPPRGGEAVHPEHLLLVLTLVLNREPSHRKPVCWHLRFVDDGEYTLKDDGQRWSLTSAPPAEPADVTVVTTMGGWQEFVRDPTPESLDAAGVEITGAAPAIRYFERTVRRFQEQAVART